MSEETYEGVPRSKILWTPRIDFEKCITFGNCVDFCHKQSFIIEEKDGKKRTVVRDPNKCVVLCRGCKDILSNTSIFASIREKTKKIIENLKKQGA
jgi:NAD-dependent dihydropyrimidine dehydrogenase PreA subunit